MLDEILKIVIAINNPETLNQVVRVTNRLSGVKIENIITNGEEAYKRIRRIKPHLVFVEAVMPGMDCVTMIDGLKRLLGKECPAFFVAYSFLPGIMSLITESDLVIQCHHFPMKDVVLAKQLEKGLDYYRGMYYIEEARRSGIGASVLSDNQAYYGEKNELRDAMRVKRIVSHELEAMGANAKLKGYLYVEEAINSELIKDTYRNRRMMELYSTVGESLGSSKSGAEKGIRRSIRDMWINGNQEYFKELWGYKVINDSNCPSNSEFLRVVLNSLEREYMM
ncbi:MAG: hypothetical protein K5656_10800 [Lachnospiraceae bacterium]|nr:hypothetical protein [Lachnospiraceae bacterium]